MPDSKSGSCIRTPKHGDLRVGDTRRLDSYRHGLRRFDAKVTLEAPGGEQARLQRQRGAPEVVAGPGGACFYFKLTSSQ